MRAHQDQVITALKVVAQPMLRKIFGPSTCIFSTKMAVDVLQHFGIQARPLPVQVLVCNPLTTRAILDDHSAPEFVRGARCVTTGREGASAEGYEGHLVAVTDDTMLDLTLDQFSTPEWGIDLPPYAFRDVNLQGGEKVSQIVNGCAVVWTPFDDVSFERTLDWRVPTEGRRFISATIRYLEEVLSEVEQQLAATQ